MCAAGRQRERSTLPRMAETRFLHNDHGKRHAPATASVMRRSRLCRARGASCGPIGVLRTVWTARGQAGDYPSPDHTRPPSREIHQPINVTKNPGCLSSQSKKQHWQASGSEPAKSGLARRPHWHVHVTPTPASWINRDERWFAELTRKQVQRGVHNSTPQIEADIRVFIENHNEDPESFKWSESAGDTLAAAKRFCLRADRNLCHVLWVRVTGVLSPNPCCKPDPNPQARGEYEQAPNRSYPSSAPWPA